MTRFFFIFLLATVIPLSVIAAEFKPFVPMQGEWLYNGQHYVSDVKQFFHGTCESKICTNKETLLKQGYQCWEKGTKDFVCVKDMPVQSVPGIFDELLDVYGAILKLYPSIAEPELVLDTTFLKQYRVDQKVTLVRQADDDHDIFEEVIYGDYGSYVKVYLQHPGSQEKFIFEKNDAESELKMPRIINVGSTTHYLRYYTTLVWERM